MLNIASSELARKFDHTILKVDTGEADIGRVVTEAIRYSFKTVCVPPCWISLASSLARNSNLGVTSVVAFPHGNITSAEKCVEAMRAVEAGATEIDIVANLGLLKSGALPRVASELRAVISTAKATRNETVCKIIVETGALTAEQIDVACDICLDVGADFIKTSTGFYFERDASSSYSPRGATVEAVKRIKDRVGSKIGIKASGGIGNLKECLQMLEAGATRIGASASVQILRENERVYSSAA